MTDIWDEKPRHIELDTDYYNRCGMDAWLEKVKAYYNELIKIKDETIIIVQQNLSEMKSEKLLYKEKAEKWDIIQESPYLAHDDPEFIISDAVFQFELKKKLIDKLVAIKKLESLWDTTLYHGDWIFELRKILEGEE